MLYEYSPTISQGSSLDLKSCIVRHLLFIHSFSKYLLSPFLGPSTFLGARSRKRLPSWDFIPAKLEKDNAMKKNNVGREKRSAGEVAILLELSELSLLSKEKHERTTFQQEGTARAKLPQWENALARLRNSMVERGAGTE